MTSLRVQVERLEVALDAETKRRISVTRQLSQQERIQAEIMRLEHDMLRNQVVTNTMHLDDRYSLYLWNERRLSAFLRCLETRLFKHGKRRLVRRAKKGTA